MSTPHPEEAESRPTDPKIDPLLRAAADADSQSANHLGTQTAFVVEARDSALAQRGFADRRTLVWWSTLYLISAGNIVLWLAAARLTRGSSDAYVAQQLLLSGIFVAACAFRSFLPRVDLERRCLWNTPLSSIFVGRSVATVAELCFATQCALLVLKLSALSGHEALRIVGYAIVPLIVVAQLACWYAVVSLNHIGHAIEEILWAAMVLLVAVSLGLGFDHLQAGTKFLGFVGLVSCVGATILMVAVDVPMYLARWRESRTSGARYLSVVEGMRDALRRRKVSRGWTEWRLEMPWMSLYFSVGVWLSLGLVFV